MAAFATDSFHAFEIEDPLSYPEEASSGGKGVDIIAAVGALLVKSTRVGMGSHSPCGGFHSIRSEDFFSLYETKSMWMGTGCPPNKKREASTERIWLPEDTQASINAVFL